MSEHQVSRVVQAPAEAVLAVVADVARLPEWLPAVDRARTLPDGEVHVEGDAVSSDGFWRPSPEQRRVEWSTPSRGGEPGRYAGWLQLEDSAGGGTEVVVHLSFLAEEPPPGVEAELGRSLEALADLVEG